MCNHTNIEVLAEIKEYPNEQILVLYTCRKCKKIFVGKGLEQPKPADLVYFEL